MAAGVKPKRTIRFALWAGEEQGLLGSKAYIESLSEDELANISAAFVDDGGTNYEGDKIDTHGGSDHAAFNKVGVPGFFWDEEGRATYSKGWHTQHDKLDLAIEEYLMQSATNAAIVAYNLANAPGLLPREGEVFETQESASANSVN